MLYYLPYILNLNIGIMYTHDMKLRILHKNYTFTAVTNGHLKFFTVELVFKHIVFALKTSSEPIYINLTACDVLSLLQLR